MRRVVFLSFGVLIASLAACERRDSAISKESASAIAAPSSAHRADSILSTRHEAQRLMDRAEQLLATDSNATLAVALRDIANFAKLHAEGSSGATQTALEMAASSLDSLAGRAATARVKNRTMLHKPFVALQLAEARYHRDRANTFWFAQDRGGTSAELTMAIDHFERAIRDSKAAPDSAQLALASSVRSISSALRSDQPMDTGEVDHVLMRLQDEIVRASPVAAQAAKPSR